MIGSVQKDGCGKLVFSAGWNPWAVAGCSLLDAAQYVSAIYEEDESLLLFLITE